jgi:hypothetical protein
VETTGWPLSDSAKKLADFRQTTFNPEESEHLGTDSASHYY